jgi:type I restriction enzyme S subunit
MSTDLLFGQFATIATAPDGIARLRELILQLAVQGKLGTQDAGDEPAAKLIERIRKEKERLAKEGKIKKEKPLEPIGDTPFILPKTWIWEKLGNCVQKITDGEHFRPNTVENGVMFLSAKDIRENYVDFSDPLFVDEGTAERCRQRCNPELNDILVVSRGAGIGRCCIISTNDFFCLLGSVILIKSSHLIDSKYLLFSLKSAIINNQITSLSSNTAQQALYIRDIKDALIPLPPLPEQHRIVAKVDRFMTICDELEARQQQERAGCLRLGTASLVGLQNAVSPEEFGRQWAQVCDAFDLILGCPENVAVLRQTILQLAVQGRLVRQEPGDEPAGKLVERIRKEKERLVKEGKIKRDKRLELIDEEEIRKSVPPNWAVTRLGEIADYNAEVKVSSEEISEDAWVFDLEDIEKDTSRILQKVRFKDRQSLSSKSRFRKGDVLYGKLRPYLDKVVVADEDGYCTTEIVPIRPYLGIDPKYLRYALKTPGFLAYVNSKTYGIKMPRLGTVDAINTLIPLPPLAEQHRIVAKVDALMALCDNLEARLKERAGIQTKFTDAVVKNVGTG